MSRLSLRLRYWRIVFFFAGVTANIIFWDIFLPRIGLKSIAASTRPNRLKRIAGRFRLLAIAMGGVMIKGGQFLSTRLDVLPPEITEELAGLQDEVPPEPFNAIRNLAEREYGTTLDRKFASFDQTPLAAASFGQAHRARLDSADAQVMGFENVVVKIQRPYIEQLVDTDLAAVRVVGEWLKRYRPISDRADVPALIKELSTTIYEEIDYIAEGNNAETFAKNFNDDPKVHVPRVVWSHTTRRSLVLEDVFAIKINDYDAITQAGIDRADVAERLLDTYLRQVFEDGFFHADPHPGNLFVTPLDETDEDGKRKWKLTFIDFGMVGRMPDDLVYALREAVIAVGLRDAGRLIRAYQSLGVLLPSANTRLIEEASQQAFERFWGMNMSQLRNIKHDDVMRFGLQFRELLYSMPFQLPENLLFLGRTVAILSGMCTGLQSDFNLWKQLAPYATKLVAEEGGSDWQKWIDEAGELFKVLIALPGRTDRVLSRVERGDLNIQAPLVNIQISYLEQSVNRLSGALIFLGLLLAGSILYSSDPQLAQIFFGGSTLALLYTLFFARGHRPF